MSHGPGRGRWSSKLGRLRRGADELSPTSESAPPTRTARAERTGPTAPHPTAATSNASWDFTARDRVDPGVEAPTPLPVRAQILAILADPRVDHITLDACARLIARPRQDLETTLDAMVQAGELVEVGGALAQYRLPLAEKQRLEAVFRSTAMELGEHGVLAEAMPSDPGYDDDSDEPRLPVTAGLLSLFLPGTGQLLNGDVGRASLVFAVWSLAWITHLSPVWTFVCLYAGAEAFFTAKIRGMERKIAKDAITGNTDGARALGP
ncbi:MAG: hypothetical protein JNK45_30230 [Myxococcales bacterium]|nr:hypothetical protein [Myxococcales bacterium]